jgi:hypothetical protein
MRFKLIRDEFLSEEDKEKLSRMSDAGVMRLSRKFGYMSERLYVTLRTLRENNVIVSEDELNRLRVKANRYKWLCLELHLLNNKRNGLGYYG